MTKNEIIDGWFKILDYWFRSMLHTEHLRKAAFQHQPFI